MEVTFRKSDHVVIEFLEKQLYDLFSYFNSCYFGINGKKRFYEGGALGFSKSGKIEIVPDVWTPGCTRKEESYFISDEMMKILNEKQNKGFTIYHFHSHLSDLPFPSADDPYNVFDLIGVVSLGDSKYSDFRIFQQLGYCSYPPHLGNIKSGKNISTLVRFDKNKRKISFFPIEEKVTIKVSDMPFLRDW